LGLELTSKTGEQRLLLIDRKTGEVFDAIKVETVTDNDLILTATATRLILSKEKH